MSNDEADDVTAPAAPETQPIRMGRSGQTSRTAGGATLTPVPAREQVVPAVEVTGLSKNISPRDGRLFRSRPKQPITVLDDVTFTIEPASAVAYLGPEGAGKTTLVELIIGETAPTSGTVRTGGLDPASEREQLVHRIGVVSGRQPQLWPDLPLDESLQILATAHGLPEPQRFARRAELVDRLELAAFVAIPVGHLSPSRKIRAEIAAALIHDPELLILDEPTFGLDVVAKEQVRAFLREENRGAGRTLLVATADLGDAEEICDRLMVVDGGRLVHDGDLPSLIERAGLQRTLRVNLIEADQRLDDVPGTKLLSVETDGLTQRLGFVPGTVPMTRVLADVAARAGIRNLTLEEPDLADLIRRLR